MKSVIYNQKLEKSGEVELSDKIFSVKPVLHIMAEVVRAQDLNARKGLAHTKTRGEVSGGGKKPWKQKGTGRARAGSTRSPIWRHGGVALGPRSDRNWEIKVNKKLKTKALFMSLTDKLSHNQFFIFDNLNFEDLKTKSFKAFIDTAAKELKDLGKKQLLLVNDDRKDLVRISRNIPKVVPMPVKNINIKEVLKADSVFITKDAVETLTKHFLK